MTSKSNKRHGMLLMGAAMMASAAVFAGCSKDDDTEYQREPTLPVTLEWNGVEIDQTEGTEWCLTRSNKLVAFTNYDEKTQYCLTWEGGLKKGEKENPVLYVSKDGSLPEEYKVSYLLLDSNGINTTLTFQCEDGTSGKIVYAIESGY